MSDDRLCIDDALRALGVRNLVLGIHDPSFPSDPAEDTGRGSPYTSGGERFLRYVRGLGFNGAQLGPQGQTSEINRSPYDGTIFSRNVLSIALAKLAFGERWGGLLSEEALADIMASKPGGRACATHYRYAFRAQHEAVRQAYAAFAARRRPGEGRGGAGRGVAGTPGEETGRMEAAFRSFCAEHKGWLERDALYEAIAQANGGAHFRRWNDEGEAYLDRRLFCPRPGEEIACAARREELSRRHKEAIELYAFGQWIAHEQQHELRELTTALGLKLYGDLQIGLSEQDVWGYGSLFLRDYLMGAPPSRTNPEGQAWNYPVFDPDQYTSSGAGPGASSEGPVLRLVRARVEKLFAEFDGVRVDHPHGLVSPWVYRAGADDALLAVRSGARLFCSPDLPDHPELARYAIALPSQIQRSAPRHADDWVTSLTPDQVRRYAVLFEVLVESARRRGRATSDLVCEVLSTMPYPLSRVLALYGLGRFRVTQKANLKDPKDVYRVENAAPEDWIMVGNHDTKPIWLLAAERQRSGAARDHAEYLASRLVQSGEGRGAEQRAIAEELAADPGKLVHAEFANVLASRAENVMIFFSDLLGLKEIFNKPGVVDDENWCLRVPNDFEREYAKKLAEGAALCLPRALALALQIRGHGPGAEHAGLVERLKALGEAQARGDVSTYASSRRL